MDARTRWSEDPIFIEIGVRRAEVAQALLKAGYSKYLGVSRDARRVAALQARHPELARRLTCSRHKRLVFNNNAEVLVLSGASALYIWKYRWVRHARSVAWQLRFDVFCLLAILCCLCYRIFGRYGWPRIVTLPGPHGRTTRLLVADVLRHKNCYRNQLHFVPHNLGLGGMFRRFEELGVRYVVLRWFESLPQIEPDGDVDLLVADDSLAAALDALDSQPGIQPCDVYSETGLSRSDYCGLPYYPAHVARRILDGAVRHNDLCMVPSLPDYFHSLAYHAVYHKGPRSNLDRGQTGVPAKGKPSHDFAAILGEMARNLGIDVDMSLEGLHAYLEDCGWGPPPELLARLAAACPRNGWLRLLAARLDQHVLDQGLTVFVFRAEAVRGGFEDTMMAMIEEAGFEILARRALDPHEVAHAAARTRGGNWGAGGPFPQSGGPPAVAVVAYDRQPLELNRRQRRKFPQRTNARIFVKEAIRDTIIAQMPPGRGYNALHSSDHAAEAWHLIEFLAPELTDEVRERLLEIHRGATRIPAPARRRAA